MFKMSDTIVNGTILKSLYTTTETFNFFTSSNGMILMKNDTKLLQAQLVMYDILIPVFGVFIIIANLLVAISSGLILKRGQEPRCTYLLLGNMALADLITGVMVVIGSIIPETVSYRTDTSCRFLLGAIVSSAITSVYSVMLIAVDRFLYILHGLKYHRLFYIKRVRCMIVATWLFGLIIGFLPLMGWSGNSKNGKMCWFTKVSPPELILLTSVIGIVPVLIVTILYSIILYRAIKKVVQLRSADNQEEPETNKLRLFRGRTESKLKINTISEKIDTCSQQSITNSEDDFSSDVTLGLKVHKIKKENKLVNNTGELSNTPSKWKAVKIVLLITGSFMFTWMPYFVTCIVFVYCDVRKAPKYCLNLQFTIASPLAILGFLNSLLNPIIYAWWHNGFRASIKKIYGKRIKIATLKRNPP